MSKQITAAVHNRIVNAFTAALDSVESSGNLVTQVCDVAMSALKGEEIPADARKLIVSDIASNRGWKDKTLRARSSEINVVLRAYSNLSDAVKLFTKKNNGKCQWHDSMKLARRLNAGDNVSQAVAAAFVRGESKSVNPAGRVAGALKAWYKVAKGEKRANILKACALLGIERISE